MQELKCAGLAAGGQPPPQVFYRGGLYATMFTGLAGLYCRLLHPLSGALVSATCVESQPAQLLFDLPRPKAVQTVFTDDCSEICAQAFNQRVPAIATGKTPSQVCLPYAPGWVSIDLGKGRHDAQSFITDVEIFVLHIGLLPIRFELLVRTKVIRLPSWHCSCIISQEESSQLF